MVQALLAIIYVAFISLGLPDALLGSAWPVIYEEFAVPVSWAGVVSIIISISTVISSLQTDSLTRRLGAGKVTVISVALTAAALIGFSCSGSFPWLCFWAVPYGLGAGCVDASLNNYVALHYESRHMSWLHCFWAIGASIGPYIMGFALTGGHGWNSGYIWVGVIQIVLTFILLISLPLWNLRAEGKVPPTDQHTLPFRAVCTLSGAGEMMVCFFCFCAIEHTAGLWASTYLSVYRGILPEAAASYAGVFYLGIMVGRAISGFLTLKMSDTQMVRLGEVLVAVGACVMPLPCGTGIAVISLALIGLGCAPIYPCMIHSTPERFGTAVSQAIMGVLMASAHCGTCLMPPLFGLAANHLSVSLFPAYILVILILMAFMYERMLKKTKRVHSG